MTQFINQQSAAQVPIRALSDILQQELTPLHLSLPLHNTYDMLCAACDRHPDRNALRMIMSGEQGAPVVDISYRLLKARITQMANALFRLGTIQGKAVTLLLPNLPETYYALFGAQAAGIASPVNPMLAVEHIASIVNETGSEILVTLAATPGFDLWDKVSEVIDLCPQIHTVLTVDPRSYLGCDVYSTLHAAAAHTKRPLRTDVVILDFDTTLASECSDHLIARRMIAGNEVCAYFHTGGTTGLPKIALHTHLNEVYVAWGLGLVQPRHSVLLCGLPLFHVNGAMVTGLAAFHSGAEIVLLTPSGYRGKGVLQNFWQIVDRFGATSFSAVPTIYAALAALPIGGANISSLAYAFCGAAPLPRAVAEKFEAASGVRLHEGYGLTEGACVSTVNPPLGMRKLGSVGLRLPYQQVQAWHIDADGRCTKACAIGETGVIGICGPNVFPGYLREADNRDIWLQAGWLNTGDLGYVDSDGYLYLTGRAKDLIIRGGHNIDPTMVEDALTKHPAVAAAAAIGQPDAHAGELPVAYVTLKPGCIATSAELLDAARDLVPERAAVPVRIDIIGEMPLTMIGKVAKTALRMRAVEHVFLQILTDNGIPALVRVNADLQRGIVAQLECAVEHEERALQLLAGFAVPCDFSQSSAVN